MTTIEGGKEAVGTLQMFTVVYRVIKGFFCNICRENLQYIQEFPCNL